MKKYVLALDQGTTSSRAILFDKEGNIRFKAQHEFTQIYPHTGWVEHNPMEILFSQLQSVMEVMAESKATEYDAVIFFGSLYLIGSIREGWKRDHEKCITCVQSQCREWNH